MSHGLLIGSGALTPGSRRMLAIAIATTLLAALIVSLLMLSMLDRFVADAGEQALDPGDAGGPPLVIGVGRVPGGPGEWNAYMSAFAALERDIEHPVVIRLLSEESPPAESLIGGDVDIALVSVNAYLRLEREHEAVLIASPIISGQHENLATVVVRADSPFEELGDLRGTHVALMSGSLAGEGYAMWVLEPFGETPESFFSAVIECESQEAALQRVARRDADTTFVPRWDLFGWSGTAFRTIAQSPEFAMPPVVARADLGPDLVEAVRRSLVSEGVASAIPESRSLGGFVTVTADDYEFARVLAGSRKRAHDEPTGGP